MAPFDNPALAAAQLRVKQWNAKGGIGGRPAADQDLRHAGQQAGSRQGLCAEAARRRREHHLHDLRRRLRRARRAGDDQPRRARGRAVHRHRSDGAEAVRPEGQARVQLRQRRAGRRLGDGAVRVGQGLAHCRPRDGRCDRLLQGRRPGVQVAVARSSAARSSTRRPTSRWRRQRRQQRGQPPNGNVKADVVVTSTAGAYGALSPLISGLRSARQRHADAELVGR